MGIYINDICVSINNYPVCKGISSIAALVLLLLLPPYVCLCALAWASLPASASALPWQRRQKHRCWLQIRHQRVTAQPWQKQVEWQQRLRPRQWSVATNTRTHAQLSARSRFHIHIFHIPLVTPTLTLTSTTTPTQAAIAMCQFHFVSASLLFWPVNKKSEAAQQRRRRRRQKRQHLAKATL